MTEEMTGAKRGTVRSEKRKKEREMEEDPEAWGWETRGEERSKRREPVLCSPASHLTALSALVLSSSPLGFSSSVSSLRGSHAGCALEYAEQLFIQPARPHPRSF